MKNHQTVNLKTIAWDAMEKYGFHPRFPGQVLQELKSLPAEFRYQGEKGVRDLRGLLWSSIDNFDSLDLDQIECSERVNDDDILVRVAIADVDYFVPKHSHADRHAAHNGTSVYTGIITFPMFPEELSEGVSSLLPGQDCMAVIIEYTVKSDGSLLPGPVYRGIVRNKAKLIYEEVGEWLEGTRDIPASVARVPDLEEQILMQNKAAQLLRRRRREHGALDLETLESQVVVADDLVTDLAVQRQDAARCLIEEFMVAANGTVVAFLEKAGLPMIHRIVRVPKYWEEIRLTATSYGFTLPHEPDARSLSDFLVARRKEDPERFPDLSLTVVKLMGAGEYVPYKPGKDPIGHFALAVTDYTHGTAPNRRYVDLIIQRLVKSVLDKTKSPYSFQELAQRAEWLTSREKASNKVERFMRKAAAAVLLKPRLGETFEGFVTGASEKGTYVRLITPPAEGRVMYREKGLKVGQKVVVRLRKTDPYNGHIDFEYMKDNRDK